MKCLLLYLLYLLSYFWYIFVMHSEIDLTLSSLETLAKVFDHPTSPLLCNKAQVHKVSAANGSQLETSCVSAPSSGQVWEMICDAFTWKPGPGDGARQSAV